MKFVVRSLKLGECVEGRIVECLPEQDLLISIEGDLLRVHNETRRPLEVGGRVTLEVRQLEPLAFRLVENRREQRRKGQLDVSV